MTIKSVKERARETQRAAFAHGGERVPAGLEDLTMGVYDQIDVLDAERRSLLLRSLLGRLGIVARDFDDPTERTVVGAILGLANYTNEVGREAASMTSTGDVAVDSIVADLQEMLARQFKAMLGSTADLVEAAAERVQARVEAGEDFEQVAHEEEAAVHAAIAERIAEKETPRRDDAPYLSDASTGLYL